MIFESKVGVDIWSQIKYFSDECREESGVSAPTPYVFNSDVNS